MWTKIKKILKIGSVLLGILLIIFVFLFYKFSTPKSTNKISEEFAKNNCEVFIKKQQFRNFQYRVLHLQEVIDTTLPTIVFIHGSIGSASDFKKYLMDRTLNQRANLIAYDRVGYGIYQTGMVQNSIRFEVELLEDLLKSINSKKIILVGYSYGGPIALASLKSYQKVILLAPAVYSKVEPMPWVLNLYKYKLLRWILPETWKAASKEKLSHRADLERFESNWDRNSSEIISIHGKKDWIVPIENSYYLKNNLPNNQFELVTLNRAGHGLVWTHFDEIKETILEQLN